MASTKTDSSKARAVAAPSKAPAPIEPVQPTPDEMIGKLLDGDSLAKSKASSDLAQSEVEAAIYEQADKAAEDSTKPPGAKSSPKPAKKSVVRDFSADKPNKPIESYKMARDGASYRAGGKTITRRESGVNRFAILIARPGGANEADLRHVNPRGYEYSGGGAGYVAQNTPINIVVKGGRYMVAKDDVAGLVPDETERAMMFEALGGEDFLNRTVEYIRGNTKYPSYSGFELSAPLVAV